MHCRELAFSFPWWDESCFRSTCMVAIAVRIKSGTSTAILSKAERMTSVSWQRWDPTDGQSVRSAEIHYPTMFGFPCYLRSLFAANREMQWNEMQKCRPPALSCNKIQGTSRHCKPQTQKSRAKAWETPTCERSREGCYADLGAPNPTAPTPPTPPTPIQ